MGKEKKAAAKGAETEAQVVPMEVNEEIGSQNEHVIEDNNIEYFIIGDNNTIHIHIHNYADGSKETQVEVEKKDD